MSDTTTPAGSRLKVTQVRSTIGTKRNARESLRSLGLKRVHHSVVVDDTPVVRGYLRTATHLLTVEAVSSDSGPSDTSTARK